MKRLAISLALGFIFAVSFVTIAFFAGVYLSEPIWGVVSLPGAKLKVLADGWLQPSGAEFILRSGRQGAHHLFAGLCILAVWTPIFSVVVWWRKRDRPSHP